nr:putative Ulp1 protease family catalytic domain-containing protein [Ipomoea batatas]
MQSYIGVLAREKVKVNYKTWKHVPEDIKEKIWEAVNLTFIVPPQFKKSCLSSANDKWRKYKTHLTNNFIWNRLSDEENLHKPPVGSGITGDEWSQFVITRMSDDFKKLSEQQKERRKQNLYPHRIARKGYARLASELSTELCDDEEVNRAILWKKGITSKQGEIQGDVLKATFSKIDAYIQQKKEGLLKLKGPKEDILTKALESKEYGGRVRGIGRHVNPSTYFSVGRGKLSSNEQNLLLRQQAKFEDIIAKLETLGKNVALTLKEETNDIVAYGTIISINCNMLTIDCMCVAIDQAVAINAPLSFPLLSTCQHVGDAVGSHVNWPTRFIKVQHKKQCKKKSDNHGQKLELNSSSLPKSLWLLYCYYKCALDDGETIKMMDENKLDKFRFVHPYHVGNFPTTRTDTTFVEEQLENRARAIADRLLNTRPNTTVLVPCNIGFHWILTVINTNNDIVYMLDPLGPRLRSDDWKHVVDMAMKMFHAVGNEKKGRSKTSWEIVKLI